MPDYTKFRLDLEWSPEGLWCLKSDLPGLILVTHTVGEMWEELADVLPILAEANWFSFPEGVKNDGQS